MKRFVGFGFGPIQAGLVLLEAQDSGNFDSFVIVEIDRELVAATRDNGGNVVVNVAHAEGIEKRTLSGISIFNPADDLDREKIVAAVHEADELATAVPSVGLYDAGGRASIVSLLAEGINPKKAQILYAAENNNYAAEVLKEQIVKYCPTERLGNFQILNTVVGKMSGVIQDASLIVSLGLSPFVPGSARALLVEEFNRILVSRVRLPDVTRGIEVFEEKDDLLPFEEAKLFGHNAVHSLLGYLAFLRGYRTMSEVGDDPRLMDLGRRAFIDESGLSLTRKYRDFGDELFSSEGFARFAEDLLVRMTNPYLNDEVARVCRDPRRKLGYCDRLIGTMREALVQGVEPVIMARGAAAALRHCVIENIDLGVEYPDDNNELGDDCVSAMLRSVWRDEETDGHESSCIELICRANRELDRHDGF